MLAPGDEGRTRMARIILIVVTLMIAVPFLLIGIGFIVAGFLTDDSIATSDGFPLRIFFFVLGGGFVVAAAATVALKVALMYVFRYLSKGLEDRKKTIAELQERGLKGTATVVELIDTGMLINHNPRVTLVLDVVVERQPAYQIRKTETVPITRLPQIQPGQSIEVLVDPNERENPDRVMIMLK
ncbi:MAG TPA: hypothetical protein VMM38_14830 [Aridibacter sp.]|nr:hypothetical protein [Aridibacter sp.]